MNHETLRCLFNFWEVVVARFFSATSNVRIFKLLHSGI